MNLHRQLHISPLPLLLALALSLFLPAPSARALSLPLDAAPETLAALHADAPATPDPAPSLAPISATSALLLRIPAGFADAYAAAPDRFLRATLRLDATDFSSPPPAAIRLSPLSAPYDPAAVAWSNAPSPSAALPSATALPVPLYLSGAPALRYEFDLLPLLASPDARSALAANGALLAIVPDASPDPAAALFPAASMLLRAAVAVPADPTNTLFAVGYIDSAPRYGSGLPSTVLWEQGCATVGKVVLNGTDGSECRAIVSFPDALAPFADLPPDALSALSVTFDLEINSATNGETLLLFPLLPGPSLERRRWEDYAVWDDESDSPPRPRHGPSWAYADGPADGYSSPTTPWPVPMAAFTNGTLGPGPWLPNCSTAVVDRAARTATFDLLPLWRDPDARSALLANGAIVLMDPSHWPRVLATGAQPRLNLFRADPFVQATRKKHSSMAILPADALPVALTSIAPAPDTLSLAFTPLDPALSYTLDLSTNLLSDPAPLAPVSDSPLVLPRSALPAASPLFFRLSAPAP